MHKDLSMGGRCLIEGAAQAAVYDLRERGDSMALAREAWLNAFDRMAVELDAD